MPVTGALRPRLAPKAFIDVRRRARSCVSPRATALAAPKRNLKWQRDPEGMRLRILEAAKQEFATHGLAGARVDRIAAKAGANKRMLYYHVGKKDELYLAVLEGAYEKIRSEERGLDLEHLAPPAAIRRLIEFTWNYFLRNPEFLSLLQTENLARAKHLKKSTKVKSMHSPFVEMIGTVVRRGVSGGDFKVAVDPVQLYISIAGLCFFYLSNSATLSVIFGRDLLAKDAKDERLDHMVGLVLAALTGQSAALLAMTRAPGWRAVVAQTVEGGNPLRLDGPSAFPRPQRSPSGLTGRSSTPRGS